MMKRFLALSLMLAVLCCGACAAAGKSKGPDPMGVLITRTFVDAPLQTAVESVLKDSGIVCRLDQDLDGRNLKVTAALNNVSRRQALEAITKMAGVRWLYNEKSPVAPMGGIHIYSDTKTVGIGDNRTKEELVSELKQCKALLAKLRAELLAKNSSSSGAEDTIVRGTYEDSNWSSTAIKLKHISSDVLLGALKSGLDWRQVAEIRALGDRQLVVRGYPYTIDQAIKIAEALDRPDAFSDLPRAIHVWIVFTLTSQGKTATIKFECVGAEGSIMPLDVRNGPVPLDADGMYLKGSVTARLLSRNLSDQSTWPDGKLISISGDFSYLGGRFFGTHFTRQDFSIVASVSNEKELGGKSGKEVVYKDQAVVASGTMDTGSGPAGFTMKVYADVEGPIAK